MIVLQRLDDLRVVLDRRLVLVVDPLEDRPRLGGRRDDAPLAAVAFEQEVDQPHMRAPEAAHDGRLAVQRSLAGVDAFELLEILLAGEDQMLVAGEHRVDALDAGDEERGVFHHLALLHVDAGMRQRDHDVGALLLHLRHPGLGGFDDVARHHIAVEVLGVPDHDLRRHEADDADPDRLLGAGAVLDLLVEDQIGLEIELVVARVRRKLGAADQIGADERKVGAGQHLVEEGQAVVELVVAERRAFVAEQVHALHDRVEVALLHALLIGDVVAHRVALQQVAIVDQHRIGGLLADAGNQRGGARQAHRVVRLVGIVVVGQHVHVDVRRLHDPEMRLVGGRARRKRMQHDDGAHGGGSCQEGAAGNLDEIGHGSSSIVR